MGIVKSIQIGLQYFYGSCEVKQSEEICIKSERILITAAVRS